MNLNCDQVSYYSFGNTFIHFKVSYIGLQFASSAGAFENRESWRYVFILLRPMLHSSCPKALSASLWVSWWHIVNEYQERIILHSHVNLPLGIIFKPYERSCVCAVIYSVMNFVTASLPSQQRNWRKCPWARAQWMIWWYLNPLYEKGMRDKLSDHSLRYSTDHFLTRRRKMIKPQCLKTLPTQFFPCPKSFERCPFTDMTIKRTGPHSWASFGGFSPPSPLRPLSLRPFPLSPLMRGISDRINSEQRENAKFPSQIWPRDTL